MFAVSTIIAIVSGFSDNGGLHYGFYQGYLQPMIIVRPGKSFVASLLLLPLWLEARRKDAANGQRLLMLSLTGAACVVLKEDCVAPPWSPAPCGVPAWAEQETVHLQPHW